jgi:predicted ArsR family transcriptional regulator
MRDMAQGEITVTDDEIIEGLRESKEPAFITKEIADIFDMSTEGMRGRLEKLKEEGRICKKKPSPRTVIWWLPESQAREWFSR